MLGDALSDVTTKQPLDMDDSHIYNSVVCCVDDNGTVNIVVWICVVGNVVVVCECFVAVDLVVVNVMVDVIGADMDFCVIVVVVDAVVLIGVVLFSGKVVVNVAVTDSVVVSGLEASVVEIVLVVVDVVVISTVVVAGTERYNRQRDLISQVNKCHCL